MHHTGSFIEMHGLSSCGAQATGKQASVVVAYGLSSCSMQVSVVWHVNLVVLWDLSFWIRDQTPVPCIANLNS